MIPNKTKKYKLLEETLFKCECGCDEYMEIYRDIETKEIWFAFISEPSTLWFRIKAFFKSTIYHKDLMLTLKDTKEMIKVLQEYVNKIEKENSKYDLMEDYEVVKELKNMFGVPFNRNIIEYLKEKNICSK